MPTRIHRQGPLPHRAGAGAHAAGHALEGDAALRVELEDAHVDLAHPPAGGTRAPVAQAWAHGMSAHTTHAWMAGSMIGVPAARPAPGGALMIACTGHTGMQSPQRVHDARKAISSAAPGGRK